MTSAERWLAALWSLVRAHLPDTGARVLDLGCGPLGGFVPRLRADGYDAIGVDPEAPEGGAYQRVEFERAELSEPFDAIVASTSLHHVSDPAAVIDRITDALMSGGRLVVLEWGWETFDRRTAEWCFARLGPDDEAGWLHRRRDEWRESELPWPEYVRDWAAREGMHRGDELVRLLDDRLDRKLLDAGPYFFPDLARVAGADEQAAIDAGEINATRIDWIGMRR